MNLLFSEFHLEPQPTNQSFIKVGITLCIFKHHAISIGLNKEEIDQVAALKITTDKEIAIELMKNFQRSILLWTRY